MSRPYSMFRKRCHKMAEFELDMWYIFWGQVTLMNLTNPALDWVGLSRGMGVPAASIMTA